ncbi:MAG: hypothetical protein JWN62_4115, partial [Acidimicrobiales bacterium]|nr:hypothetical protein [Acidimicrobiales bacterium]
MRNPLNGRGTTRRKHALIGGLLVALVAPVISLVSATPTSAAPNDPVTVYDSIGTLTRANVPSTSYQANQIHEFGDAVRLAPGPRALSSITVEMSSWACQTGGWSLGNCVTTPGTTFTQPLTINVYAVTGDDSAPAINAAAPLVTSTQSFAIPFRPNPDTTHCIAANQEAGYWYDATANNGAGKCYGGVAAPVTFTFPGNTVLPDRVVWSVGFNTSQYGKNPVGTGTACFAANDTCPYDSLNVGSFTLAPQAYVGTDIDEPATFLSTHTASNFCDTATAVLDVLRNDGGCPTGGFRPLAKIVAKPVVDPVTVYDSIGNLTAANVPSTPFQAGQINEFGDAVRLAAGPRALSSITVEMDSWACQTGGWSLGNCVTTPGSTFTQPLTINVYAVTGDDTAPVINAAAPIVSSTQSFQIPFRPNPDTVNCTGSSAGYWFDATANNGAGKCYGGVVAPVTFTFPGTTVLPDRIVWSVALNTSNFGKNPVGTGTACYAANDTCAYDALNLGSITLAPNAYVGTDIDEPATFMSTHTASNFCDSSSVVLDVLRNDGGCTTGGYRPLAKIVTVT